MVETADHIINKEIFEFSCSEAEHAFALQQQMNNGLQHKMQFVLETVLTEWNAPDQTIRLDKLQIDLGTIPFDQLTELLPARFQIEFKEKLSAAIIERKIARRTEPPCDIAGVNELPDEIESKIELLKIFLLSGRLPWWAGPARDFSIDETISQLIKDSSVAFKALLLKYITHEQFMARLFYQTGINACSEVMELLGISPGQIAAIETDLQKIFPSQLSGSPAFKKNILRLLVKSIRIDNLSPNEQTEFFLKTIKEVFGYSIDPGTIDISPVSLLANKIVAALSVLSNKIPETTGKDEQAIIENREKIFIQNAGLVLVATFLPALFKELQWTSDGKFINKDHQVKAVFLLHYLSTGDIAAPEYTLQLNKILCGLDLEEPIPFSAELTDKEKNEADQLLEDIITHWTVLKNSSVEGLQGSFIIRDGLLSFSNERWLLQVDRKGYDILLDQIPWSWKMIRSDWMNTYIETEW
jgi:hypothetical protein